MHNPLVSVLHCTRLRPLEKAGVIVTEAVKFSYFIKLPLLILFALLKIPQMALCEELLNLNASNIVPVRILHSSTGRCGSGFISGTNKIVTAAHVARSVCGAKICEDLSLILGDSAEIHRPVVSVIQIINSLDVALLEISPELLPDSNKLKPVPSNFSGIAGYPSCGDLTLSSGGLTRPSSSTVYSSALGMKGSSGSPIFLDGSLIGIALESDGLLNGTLGLFLKVPHKLKGRPVEALKPLTEPIRQSLITEAQLIENEFINEVLNLRGLQRIVASIRYLERVRNFSRRLSASDEPEHSLAGFNGVSLGRDTEELIEQVVQRPSALSNIIIKLFLRSYLERVGFWDEFLTPVPPQSITKVIYGSNLSPSSKNQLLAIITETQQAGYPGVEWVILWYVAIGSVVVSAFLASLGYIWGRVRGEGGSFLHAALTTIIIALLLWPVGWFLFLIKRHFFSRKK
jgi:hypothetical protein